MQRYLAGFLFNLTGLILTTVLLTGCGRSNSVPAHIEADWSAEGLSTAEEAGDMTVIGGDDESSDETMHNLSTALSVPTQITRIGDFYFIVDCYNDQVIYSPTLDLPLNEWCVMTGDINKGHTVASDGEVYLTDDTERHRILAFVYDGNRFVNTQIFENIGSRPHFIVYNEADKSFYVWSDYIFAPAWCVIVFWFAFRSPPYWHLGSLKGYKLSAQSAYGIAYARRLDLTAAFQ